MNSWSSGWIVYRYESMNDIMTHITMARVAALHKALGGSLWLLPEVASVEEMKASLKSLLDVGNGQAREAYEFYKK